MRGVLLVLVLVAMVGAWAGENDAKGVAVKSLVPKVLLADGAEFKTWEAVPRFTKTYHVDQGHERASDEGPGTKAQPFESIGRAAEVLRPGERVVVAEGVYREHVKPARGGTSPTRMIPYEAAPGATVVIKGSKVFAEAWTRSTVGGARSKTVWRGT